MMKLRFAAGPSLALAVFAAPAVTQTRPATQAAMRPAAADASDAADLYRRAMAATPAGGPTNGLVFYSTAPPYPPAWHRLADAAYKANAATLALVRAARGIDRVVWPAPPDPQLPVLSRLEWLNQWVAVANEVQDAALVEHLRGDDAAAVGRVIDLLHMSDLLDGAPQSYRHVAASVGANITAKAMNRLLVITSSATLSDDPRDARALQVKTAEDLIASLLDQPDPTALAAAAGPQATPDMLERGREHFRRANAERTFAAMSLACHLYRRDHQAWPAKLDDLVPAHLPRAPVDPWGDGTEPFGYALLPNGLPDGSPRPVVYDRCLSRDGLFARTDGPHYGFYQSDGSTNATLKQRQGGQARDVASWHPPANAPAPIATPTTRPLP